MIKQLLGALVLVLAFAVGASAQESEVSGGGGGTAGAITAGVGSGAAGRIPQFASTTSLVDSKMLTSGTNSGTWTLYDNTGGSGVTKLVLRDGAGNSSASAVLEPYTDGGEFLGSTSKRFNVIAYSFGTVTGGPPGGMLLGSGTSAFRYYSGSVSIGSTATFDFSTGDPAAVGNDLGFTRSAAGILKVTDGSTGSGDIWAGNMGIGAAPVATTGLYIKAATGMTSHLYLEGTGGVINPAISLVDALGNVTAIGAANSDIAFSSAAYGLGFYFRIPGGSGNALALRNGNDNGYTYLGTQAAGMLKVTLDDGTTPAGFGYVDAATNTVTDALILRHATSDAGFGQDGFGTGLLFQGEDDAGNMNSMAQIQAVYTDSANGSEDADFKFYGMRAGTSTLLASFDSSGLLLSSGAHVGGSTALLVDANAGDLYLQATGNIRFGTIGVSGRWIIDGTAGYFAPQADNTYDIGTSAARVRDAYVSTSIQGTRTQAITDNAAAATFVTIAVPTSNTTVGGRIFYTITAIDAGTAIQTKTGTYSFGLNNIGGTVTGAGTDVLEHSQLSTGTLAPTFSVNISGTNAQFQLVLNTSLDAGAETLKIEYRVQIDSGTATVTPAT